MRAFPIQQKISYFLKNKIYGNLSLFFRRAGVTPCLTMTTPSTITTATTTTTPWRTRGRRLPTGRRTARGGTRAEEAAGGEARKEGARRTTHPSLQWRWSGRCHAFVVLLLECRLLLLLLLLLLLQLLMVRKDKHFFPVQEVRGTGFFGSPYHRFSRGIESPASIAAAAATTASAAAAAPQRQLEEQQQRLIENNSSMDN